MDKVRILVVDDEAGIRDIIEEYIRPQGYLVDKAEDGRVALAMFSAHEYAVMVLDVMMPYVDGWSVCREVRKSSSVPIIMLTARGEEYDKLLAFELGVDDYIVKPFSPKELLARIKAIIRRSYPEESRETQMRLEGLEIDTDSRNVSVDGEKVRLTPKEYELLYFLVKNPNKVFSRSVLLDKVWGYDFDGDDRTVDTHVKMLRDSIGPYKRWIVTVWGTGYKFETGNKV